MEVYSGRLDGCHESSIWLCDGVRLWLVCSAVLNTGANYSLFGSALSIDFQTKMYVFVSHPTVAMAALLLLAAILTRFTVRFEHFRSTMWLLTTVFIYTFGATIISDLFMVFPCFEAADGLKMMIHDPSKACYGYSTLMVLAPIAICVYTATAMYVLGFAFWSRKGVIQNPEIQDRFELDRTFKAFGFLFYGAHAHCLTNYHTYLPAFKLSHSLSQNHCLGFFSLLVMP